MTVFVCRQKSVPFFATTSKEKAEIWVKNVFLAFIENHYTFVSKTDDSPSYTLKDGNGNEITIDFVEISLYNEWSYSYI